MKISTRLALVLLPVICSCSAAQQHATVGPNAAVVQGYHVQQVLAAGDGRLEVMEDERLTASTRPVVIKAFGGNPCVQEIPRGQREFCDQLKGLPLRHAFLRLRSARGDERSRLPLERATAELSRLAVSNHGDSVTAVSVDLSAGMGSYSGPVTRFPEEAGGRLRWTSTIRDAEGDRRELDLPTTLKTGWQVSTTAKEPEILMVACRPDFDHPAVKNQKPGFTITFTRFYQRDGVWHRVDRTAPGFWENDDPFPARALFP